MDLVTTYNLTSVIALFLALIKSKAVTSEARKIYKNSKGRGLGVLFHIPISVPHFAIVFLFVAATMLAAVIIYFSFKQEQLPKGIILDTNTLIAFIFIIVFSLAISESNVRKIISKGLLIITKDQLSRFDHGWINANWHVSTSSDESYAISINKENANRLANLILNQVAHNIFEYRDQTPSPNIPKQDLANYYLLGNAIESRIHQDYRNSRTVLEDWWSFLDWCSRSEQRPFSPEFIKSIRSDAYFDYLIKLSNRPEELTISDFAENVKFPEILTRNIDILKVKFDANALNLANSWMGKKSMNSLLKNLKKFKRFDDAEYGQNYVRLFFKQTAIRENLWQGMKIKRFLYPYSSGIPIVLLNSEVLNVIPEKTRIEVDVNFKDLVASAVSEVVEELYQTILRNPERNSVVQFKSKTRVGEDENKLADFVDFWFFSQGRHSCSKMTSKDNISIEIECTLKETIAGKCICEESSVRWIRSQHGNFEKQ